MPDKPAAERTEQPTPKRLSKAREKGQLPQSQEFMSVATLWVLVATIALSGSWLMNWLIEIMKEGISAQTPVFTDSRAFMIFAKAKIVDFILLTSPFFIAFFTVSVLTGVAVGGLNFSPAAINLKLSSINPIAGFQKLFNGRSLVRLVMSIAKLLFISLVVWLYLNNKIDTFATLRWATPWQILIGVAKIILGLMIRVCIVLLVIGIADVFYQKWKYIDELKMTRQEVKEERKHTEGSPEIKMRIRKIQFQMATKRMLKEVPKANVVLVNPEHVAVALRYEAKTMDSPVVVAKGADYLAGKIREIAQANGVPIIRRPELARAIYKTVEAGSSIPEVLYIAVAEVLAAVYRMRHRR
ncbi:MAG: flagellar biosynthesis protein FlhB [Planctomycetota bacterium]|jgi:flagellar biosynthetic protein FlhB